MQAGSLAGIELNATFALVQAFSGAVLVQGVFPGPLQRCVAWRRGSPVEGSTYSAFHVSV